MSYTKGKWERDKLTPNTIVCGNKIIASVASPDDFLAYEDKWLEGAKTKEAKANARLIAAAPQLLEACKYAKNHMLHLNKQVEHLGCEVDLELITKAIEAAEK